MVYISGKIKYSEDDIKNFKKYINANKYYEIVSMADEILNDYERFSSMNSDELENKFLEIDTYEDKEKHKKY